MTMDTAAYFRNRETEGYRYINAYWTKGPIHKQEMRWSLMERIDGRYKRVGVATSEEEAYRFLNRE